MDFNLVQSYILKLPELDDIKKTPEVKEIISKYSEKIVEEYLQKLIDKRHKEIVSAMSSEDLQDIDFSFDYYIKTLKKSLITEKGRPLKKVINGMGIIYSDHIGNRFYSKEVLEKFNLVFNSYTNIEFDEEKSEKSFISDEIVKLLQTKIKNKDIILLNNMTSSLYLIGDTFYKDKDLLAGLGDNYYFSEGAGLYDVIEKSGAKLKLVGFSNKISIEDYLKEIKTKDELILYSEFIGNFAYNIPKISFEDISKIKNIAKTLYLGDNVYLNTESEEIKSIGQSLEDLMEKDFEYYIIDMSKIGGLPDISLLISSKENIARLKNNPLKSIMKSKKETEVLFYFALKELLEGKTKSSYLNICFDLKEEELQIKNRRFVRNIERELGDLLEINIIKGSYFSLNENIVEKTSFERELIHIKPLNIKAELLEKELRFNDPSIYCWLNEGALILNLQLVKEEEEDLIIDLIIKKVKTL